MRILFLPKYGPRGASSRYRIWQYVPLFERAGHEVEVQPLLDDGYLGELYSQERRGWRWLASGYGRRLFGAFRFGRFDAIIFDQEMLPFLPAFVELAMQRRNARFFVDYDDAAYANYARWPWLREKIARIMAAAETVVVGNTHLAGYARQFARRVCVIPTVIDLASYPNHRQIGDADKVHVGWIGTPMTAKYVQAVIPVMERLQRAHPKLNFRLIGAGNGFSCNGLRAEVAAWSRETESELLLGCDIGIMPLPDTEFTRGKCGLKLIQYMACGLPVVASPVGVNREIVEEGRNGHLATSADEWYARLDGLIRDPGLRMSMGKAGREKVAGGYTLEHGFSQWQEILEGELHGK